VSKKGSGTKDKLKLLVATRNIGKLKEFQHFLSDMPVELLSLRDFPELKQIEEPFNSFEENAYHKAVQAFCSTGLISLGDDSGLEVEALKGAPGVYSARFAGRNATDTKNNEKLLRLLKDTPLNQRSARFVCVLALAISDKKVKIITGEAKGLILFKPRGNLGFGYDPLFYVPGLKKTFAELSPEKKLEVSHRGDALRKLKPVIEDLIQKRDWSID
jgi:XTP/dITP diphosphohydrolase